MQELYLSCLTFRGLWRVALGRSAPRGCREQPRPPSSRLVPRERGALRFPTGGCCAALPAGAATRGKGCAPAPPSGRNETRILQRPGPDQRKTRSTGKLNSSRFAPEYESITGAYASSAGKKGVKTALQEAYAHESKAPSELYRKL